MAKKQAKAAKQPDPKEQELIQFAEQMGKNYTQELKNTAKRIAKIEPGMSSEHYLLRAEYQLLVKRHKQLMRSEEEFTNRKEAIQ